MKTIQRETKELKEATEPLLKYLNNNCHPHVVAIVTPTSIELLEGLISLPRIMEYVKD